MRDMLNIKGVAAVEFLILFPFIVYLFLMLVEIVAYVLGLTSIITAVQSALDDCATEYNADLLSLLSNNLDQLSEQLTTGTSFEVTLGTVEGSYTVELTHQRDFYTPWMEIYVDPYYLKATCFNIW